MNRTALRRTVAAAAAAGLVVATPLLATSTAHAAEPRSEAVTVHQDEAGEQHAVFVMTDDPDGNGVIAFARADDGTLTRGATYPTGGLGARLDGAVVDPLASQDALTYDEEHHLLLAVNGGSDTVTVFGVEGSSLHRLQVVSSRGTLPVSVSVRDDIAYVLNAGGDGSVAGFRVGSNGLRPLSGSVRSIGLGNPALPNFLHSPAQVAISPDARHLVVTTKLAGDVVVWRLGGDGRPAANAVVNHQGTVPFSVAFDQRGHVLLSDAAGRVSSWSVRGAGLLTPITAPVSTFGAATCWIISTGRYAYAANTGSGFITGFAVSKDGSLTRLDADGVTASSGPAPIDLAAADGVLYVENGANGSLSSFEIEGDGSLVPLETITGLTADGGTGIEGLVAI